MKLSDKSVSYDSEYGKNDGKDRCPTGKLLFFCLTLIFAEVRIAGSTADRAGKTAFLRALEKYEHYESDSDEKNNSTENIRDSNHFYKPPIRRKPPK